MDERISLDREIDVPFALLDPSPWNPKNDISGAYKKGLIGSIDYFGIRDRLKIWPNPHKKGRFYVLNGNKRLNILEEYLLETKIRAHFKLADDCTPAIFAKVKEDPDNQAVIEKLRRSLPACQVKCQVMTKLDSDTPFTITDAKTFSSTYDRNHAKFDEVKLADNYREVREERLKSLAEGSRKIFEARLKAMVRPELPVVEPRQKSQSVSENVSTFQFADPGTFQPTESEPWGPSPPSTNSNGHASSSQSVQFVPMVFSLSKEGYELISSSVLRSKSRIFRENTLKRALTKLEQITELSTLDDDIDSIIVETALLLIDKRIEVLENNNV